MILEMKKQGIFKVTIGLGNTLMSYILWDVTLTLCKFKLDLEKNLSFLLLMRNKKDKNNVQSVILHYLYKYEIISFCN